MVFGGRQLCELVRETYFRKEMFGVSDEKRKPSVSSSSQYRTKPARVAISSRESDAIGVALLPFASHSAAR
jgi:hypothetical protein